MKPTDSYAIAALMVQIDGWERTKERKRLSPYWMQRLYRLAAGLSKPEKPEIPSPLD